MSKTKISIDLAFPYHYADGISMWRVVKARGNDTWECVVNDDSPDYAGTRKVFGGEEIRNALASSRFWDDMHNAHEAFWNAQEIGATVHYHNGFGEFVRGVVVLNDGKKQMRPTALVGKWRADDLPHYNAAGDLIESHYVRKIRNGDQQAETMQPNYSNMVEAVGVRPGETDPRGQPAIDLTPPQPTPEVLEARRLMVIHDHVLALLLNIDTTKGRPHSEAAREALEQARDYLIANVPPGKNA